MKVAVGLSGGVDSAVAALLLREAGHEVVGVTMMLGRDDETGNVASARTVADWLDIPLYVTDFADAWKRQVLSYVSDTYRRGETPNPCIRCNETVKFSLLPRWAFEALGCSAFATGHYAQLKEGRLYRAVDHAKDQSYFLYRVPQDVLERTMFPLGTMTKAEVRYCAHARGFVIADRADSQDFCGGDPRQLLEEMPREGEIATIEGKAIAKHRGYWNYTVGQRRGLGIGGGTPYYVMALDAKTNRVLVGSREQATIKAFSVREVCWRKPLESLKSGEQLAVKVRSASEPVGPVTFDGEICRCPMGILGVAPGQSAVFYRGEEVCGGGIIA